MIVTSAILTGLAHQPLGMGWLAWFSMIPFIIGIRNICSFKDHLKLGFTWGFFYNFNVQCYNSLFNEYYFDCNGILFYKT